MSAAYLKFVALKRSAAAKTLVWEVRSTHGDFLLGHVRWQSPWRKYVFAANGDTIFDADCMHEIADFCSDKTHEHRSTRKRSQ